VVAIAPELIGPGGHFSAVLDEVNADIIDQKGLIRCRKLNGELCCISLGSAVENLLGPLIAQCDQ